MSKKVFRCTCTCSFIDIEKWDDDGEIILTLYERTCFPNENILDRVKRAIRILLGKECLHGEVILTKKDFEEFKETINKLK